MTLTYRIHSFEQTRNAKRAIRNAADRVTEACFKRDEPFSVAVSFRDNTLTVFITDDPDQIGRDLASAEYPSQTADQVLCRNIGRRLIKDVMLVAGRTFNADLI